MRFAAPLLLLPLAAAAQERVVLDCATRDGEAVEVTLWNRSEFGEPVHCVQAAALTGLVACAPQGGWGIGNPASPARLAAVATDSREAAAMLGPKLFAHLGPSQFVASASEGPDLPFALEVAGRTVWRLRLTLASGEGVMESREGEDSLRCVAG